MPEKPRLKMENILDGAVTRRSPEKTLNSLDLDKSYFLELPQNAVVVEVGSGISQEFEKWLRGFRPDLRVISIDPTLSLDPGRTDIRLTESKDDCGYDGYRYNISDLKLSPENVSFYRERQKKRREDAPPGAIVAIAPDLPIADESVDFLIDSCGPILYLSKERITEYFENVVRCLKPGGEARLAPFSRRIFDQIHSLREILPLLPGAKIIPFPAIYDFSDERMLGVIIRKETVKQDE